jgi:hypothetical protein
MGLIAGLSNLGQRLVNITKNSDVLEANAERSALSSSGKGAGWPSCMHRAMCSLSSSSLSGAYEKQR